MGIVLSDLSWPIRTERLVIRPATVADAEAVWTYRRDPDAYRWVTAAVSDLAGFRDRFAAADRLARTLVIEEQGAIIGDLSVTVGNAWAQAEVVGWAEACQAELGWCLAARAVGHGYAAEAVQVLFAVCFDGLGLRRVTANCFVDNHASARLMQRLGMRQETYRRADSLHRNGQWMDGMGYAMLAEEWRAGRVLGGT